MEVNDKHHYVVVTGIVIKDGKYLIVKRSENEKAFPGRWSEKILLLTFFIKILVKITRAKFFVSGGKLEKGDYSGRANDTAAGQWYNILEDLLRREVKEEAGLEIKNIKYLTSLCFVRPDDIPVVIISLYAEHHGGEVVLNEEGVEHAWVSLEEARNYDLIDGILEEIEMVDKLLNGEEVGEWGR